MGKARRPCYAPFRVGPFDWAIGDWQELRGDDPIVVEGGFSTKLEAWWRIEELRAGQEAQVA